MQNRLLRCLLALSTLPALVLPAGALGAKTSNAVTWAPQRAAKAAPPAVAGGQDLGLSASDWAQIRAAHEASRHAFSASASGFRAETPGQAWVSEFDHTGFTTTPVGGDWSWGLELKGYGRGAALRPLEKPLGLAAEGTRLEREWDQGLTEWYVNSAAGLEHGFTLQSAPQGPGPRGDPLVLDLSIRGGLLPVPSEDGRDVSFHTDQGLAALNYNGLKVFDANGQPLAARWQNQGTAEVRLLVDDSGACYPLTIDPIAQQALLKASNPDAQDYFGYAVALSGDTLVVGSPLEDSDATGVNGNQGDSLEYNSGAVYVFVRNGTNWTQEAYLKASNTQVQDLFGWAVGISGDTIVVGAYPEAGSIPGINGDPLDNNAPGSGAVFVFVRNGATWTQQAYIKASNPEVNDLFGYSVAISADTLVVGAHKEDSSATGVNGNQSDNSAIDSGAVYVFVRSGTNWSQQAYLKASNTEAGDFFGWSVAISGDTLVAGAIEDDSSATSVNGNQVDNSAPRSGAAYVFARNGATWAQQAYLKGSATDTKDEFGWSVAASGDTVVVGAPYQGPGTVPGEGAAYAFVHNGSTWSEQAHIPAPNQLPPSIFDLFGDQFGRSVGISGDTMVVGAPWEDSGASGINGDQTDNSVTWAGAAYVLVRNGATWSHQAYLKASETLFQAQFGNSVAISGDVLVAGAWGQFATGECYAFDLDNNLGTAAFGTGSAGCAGPILLDVNHAPMIGSPGFALTCSNAPPSSLGFGVLATSPDVAGSDPFGLGVLLHLDPNSAALLALPFSSDAQGNGRAALAIPNIPALVGKTLYAQALWSWSTCALPPFNLSTSSALALTFLVP